MQPRARVLSAALRGVEAEIVYVEVTFGRGIPGTTILGLPDSAVRESRDRVKAAIAASGFDFPSEKILVNLAPAHIRKEGPWFDLPIAVAILHAAGALPGAELGSTLLLGELALDGTLRPARGALAAALAAARFGLRRMCVAPASAAAAALVDGVAVFPTPSLASVAATLAGGENAVAPLSRDEALACAAPSDDEEARLEEIVGQSSAKRALAIAAAGGHNLLFVGPPGAGKSMLARRLPAILPEPTLDELLEITQIRSALRSHDAPLQRARPFRAPHHATSRAGLVGGGLHARPGEVTLAHRGVLFLDELPEFPRDALEALRQPLEEGHVLLARAAGAFTLPARFQLVAAMNPCPCGWRGHPTRPCVCAPRDLHRYRMRLSGPLLDRIDLFVAVAPVSTREIAAIGAPALATDAVRARVRDARDRQRARGPRVNASLAPSEAERFCKLDGRARELLDRATDRLSLSMRARSRCARVARTIADLDCAGAIAPEHVAEALSYRLVAPESRHVDPLRSRE